MQECKQEVTKAASAPILVKMTKKTTCIKSPEKQQYLGFHVPGGRNNFDHRKKKRTFDKVYLLYEDWIAASQCRQ